MILTEQKPIEEILKSLKEFHKIFLIGCGECATTCKTGGKEEVALMQQLLEKHGKVVVGSCMPDAPCVAAQVKTSFAKHLKELKEADAVLVLACGLGAQSVKDNERRGIAVLPACNSLAGVVVDSKGNLFEKCSLCGECVLDTTGGICPVTLCAKSLLNGPCGGMNKGKCEIDPEKDCAWVLIYKEAEKKKRLQPLKAIHPARNFKKSQKPHSLIIK
jgi:ferredoxin